MIKKLKQNKAMVVAILASLVIGVAFGRWATPEKVVKVVETVEIEKEIVIEKKVLVKEEVKKSAKRVNKKTKKVTKPDGTVIEESVESTEDVKFADTSSKEGSSTEAIRSSTSVSKKEQSTAYKSKYLSVSLLAGAYRPSDEPGRYRGLDLMYGLHAQYRFLGPVSVGAFATTTNEYGLSVGIEF